MFLRTVAIASAIGAVFLATSAFKNTGNQKFSEIDVERINIVGKGGTVKMIITNAEKFPNKKDEINRKSTDEDRKKRSGMLFFTMRTVSNVADLFTMDKKCKWTPKRAILC